VLTPLLDDFLAALRHERLWGQVLIRRMDSAFELRHVEDRGAAVETLREVRLADLRPLAAAAANGSFRPLKSTPTLRTGWRCRIADGGHLVAALDELYPGSLADWWAVIRGQAMPKDYPDAVARQLGSKAAALARLRGPALAATVHASCSPSSCLKHRRWSAPDVLPDDGLNKSAIPCLEPCPVFLTFARACAASEESPTVGLQLAPEDLATVVAALRHALERPPPSIREGEVGAVLHPWRITRLLERQGTAWVRASEQNIESYADL
jgi:hypothetical protein